MTTRELALNLREHIPPHIRKATRGAMMREDMRRFKKGDALVDKDELLKMAQDNEAFLLEFETEQRAAGLTSDARDTEPRPPAPIHSKAPPCPMEDRLGGSVRRITYGAKKRIGRQSTREEAYYMIF